MKNFFETSLVAAKRAAIGMVYGSYAVVIFSIGDKWQWHVVSLCAFLLPVILLMGERNNERRLL